MNTTMFVVETEDRMPELEKAFKDGKVLCHMINKKLSPATFKALRPFLRDSNDQILPVNIHKNYYFCLGSLNNVKKALTNFEGLTPINVSVY